MYIDNTIVAMMVAFWLISIIHMYYRGRKFGWTAGVMVGVTHTVNVLEKHGILTDAVCKKILNGDYK